MGPLDRLFKRISVGKSSGGPASEASATLGASGDWRERLPDEVAALIRPCYVPETAARPFENRSGFAGPRICPAASNTPHVLVAGCRCPCSSSCGLMGFRTRGRPEVRGCCSCSTAPQTSPTSVSALSILGRPSATARPCGSFPRRAGPSRTCRRDSALACPAESTNRSRSGHDGSSGAWRRNRVHTVYAMGAMPIGAPG